MILVNKVERAGFATLTEELKLYQQQPYDSTLKSLLEDQAGEIISYLVEGAEYEEKMDQFDSLLEQNPYVQRKKEEGREEGEVIALQRSVVNIVRKRFPALTDLAQQQVAQINKPDVLDYLIEQISIAPDEAIVRFLLSPSAA